nr:ent-copalyl diphosphate synthase, chloroplastic-like [Tanacetum cinerariifolium]
MASCCTGFIDKSNRFKNDLLFKPRWGYDPGKLRATPDLLIRSEKQPVNRLQRLGIANYFRSEIEDCVAYIYRYWDEQGIGFARFCNVPDLDDTAMAFRILRMNGYQVSPDVFRHFVKDGEFVCYPGQSRETVTVMLNLYRASQMLFPGEKILNDAKSFSHTFLTEKQSANELFDRWIITKDLGGEVKYALDVPWMGNISNNKYLELAKLDYNHCQAIHQREWSHIQKSCFTNADMRAFVEEFINPQNHKNDRKPWHMVRDALNETLNDISSEVLAAHGVDIHPHLHNAV